MRNSIGLLLAGLFVAAVLSSETHGSNFSVPTADGWYTWQVEAVDGSELELFALMEAGSPVRFRARGNSVCFTGLPGDAVDLGHIGAEASVTWLQNHIYPVSDLSSEAILMISLHAGELPVDVLEQLLAVAEN